MGSIQLTASRHILPFAAFLDQNGQAVGPLLHQAGLPGSCLDDPKTLVPTQALWKFRELTAIHTDLPNVTLNVMEPLDLAQLGDLGRILHRAPTLGGMIQDFRRMACAESASTVINLRPYRSGGHFFSHRMLLGHRRGEWHAELYILMWMLKIVRLFDETFSPTEIWCVSSRTRERFEAIESLAARPRFNQQCTGFPLPNSMLALSRRSSDSGRRNRETEEARLWSMAPSNSAAGAIQQMIRAYARDRWPTIEEAAAAVGLNVRTLQRQLSAEGKTYFVLADETRAEMARQLLNESDFSLSEIAERTGYSDLSNFNRAFRRWSRVSPREFRAQSRDAA